jgi:ribosomal protein L24E
MYMETNSKSIRFFFTNKDPWNVKWMNELQQVLCLYGKQSKATYVLILFYTKT